MKKGEKAHKAFLPPPLIEKYKDTSINFKIKACNRGKSAVY